MSIEKEIIKIIITVVLHNIDNIDISQIERLKENIKYTAEYKINNVSIEVNKCDKDIVLSCSIFSEKFQKETIIINAILTKAITSKIIYHIIFFKRKRCILLNSRHLTYTSWEYFPKEFFPLEKSVISKFFILKQWQ